MYLKKESKCHRWSDQKLGLMEYYQPRNRGHYHHNEHFQIWKSVFTVDIRWAPLYTWALRGWPIFESIEQRTRQSQLSSSAMHRKSWPTGLTANENIFWHIGEVTITCTRDAPKSQLREWFWGWERDSLISICNSFKRDSTCLWKWHQSKLLDFLYVQANQTTPSPAKTGHLALFYEMPKAAFARVQYASLSSVGLTPIQARYAS